MVLFSTKKRLFICLPGQAGGAAAAKLLTGEISPSGKLTETWPLRLADVPSFGSFGKKYTWYGEGLCVGYRYYQKAKAAVRFPFGYGLSYTHFEYTDLRIEDCRVTATIANIGSVPGAEVVQLYVAPPQDGPYRPLRELKGFEKVFLQPGESKDVSFELNDRSFAIWSDGWKIPGGVYGVELGASCADIRLRGELAVEGESVPAPAWQKGSWYEKLRGRPLAQDFEKLFGGPILPEPAIKKGCFTMEMSTMEMKDRSPVMKAMFKATEKTIAQGFGGKADYSDPTFKMMVMSGADAPLRAAVLSSSGAFPANVAEGLLATANGHPLVGLKKLGGK